jgi:hypothetical protein
MIRRTRRQRVVTPRMGGVRGTGMSRYSVRATCPDVLAVQEKVDIIAKVP